MCNSAQARRLSNRLGKRESSDQRRVDSNSPKSVINLKEAAEAADRFLDLAVPRKGSLPLSHIQKVTKDTGS